MDVNTITSTALLDGLRDRGNSAAWQQFMERYEPMLMACAKRAGLGEHDSRDVVQETLIAFMEAYREGKYERDRGRLRHWLQGIVFNKVRQAWRRHQKREVQIVDETSATNFINRVPDEAEMTDIFEEEWEQAVLNECLREARRQVDEKTFQAFKLYTMDSWPPEKVAEHLGITKNAVYVYKKRVLSRLRRLQEQITEVW